MSKIKTLWDWFLSLFNRSLPDTGMVSATGTVGSDIKQKKEKKPAVMYERECMNPYCENKKMLVSQGQIKYTHRACRTVFRELRSAYLRNRRKQELAKA